VINDFCAAQITFHVRLQSEVLIKALFYDHAAMQLSLYTSWSVRVIKLRRQDYIYL